MKAISFHSSLIFYRWLKFNCVGAIGVVLQLSALALFNRLFRGHYLLATIAALELTLLNNFVWHLHYTWRDVRGPILAQLLRFHLSNGLVSLLGNLVITRLLVAGTRLPLVAANAIAILCCSLVNFFVSHHWIFANTKLNRQVGPEGKSKDERRGARRKTKAEADPTRMTTRKPTGSMI